MSCGSCGNGGFGKLCPFSFGLALGLTSGLAVFFWSLWVMYYGMPPTMAEQMPPLTFMGSIVHSLLVLVKGFVFGFFVAMIYDWIVSRCKSMYGKSSGSCGCGPSDKSGTGK